MPVFSISDILTYLRLIGGPKKVSAHKTREIKVSGASWRCDVMTQLRHGSTMPHFHSLVHISHITGLFGGIGRKKCKKPDFSENMTSLRHDAGMSRIFLHGYTCLYTICIFSEGLKPIEGSTSHRESFFEAISSILHRNLLTFLSHNSGTAGPILDSKVALERQFIVLSLRSY